MSKYYGAVGYTTTVETRPGIYEPTIIEREYTGDVIRHQRNWQAAESINDDIVLSNRISIVADDYAYENIGNMRYVTFLGKPWKVKSVDFERPRLVITLGGIYNGQVPA